MEITFNDIYGNDLAQGRGFQSFRDALDTIDPERHERVSFWRVNYQVYMLEMIDREFWAFTPAEDGEVELT